MVTLEALDFFTKLLLVLVQGGLFKKLRDMIMGQTPYPTEERVETKKLG